MCTVVTMPDRALYEVMLDREMVYMLSLFTFPAVEADIEVVFVCWHFHSTLCLNLHWQKSWQRLMSCQYYDGAFSLLLRADHSWCKLMLLVNPWNSTGYVIITQNSLRRCLQLFFLFSLWLFMLLHVWLLLFYVFSVDILNYLVRAISLNYILLVPINYPNP